MNRMRCWICALPGGGHGGPVYWLQAWHLHRLSKRGYIGHYLRNVRIKIRSST